MANIFIEARPKGRPEGAPIEDFVAEDPKTTLTMCSAHARRNEKQSTGRRLVATRLLSLGFGI